MAIFIAAFSIIIIILHHFHIDNVKGKTVIGYDMIIGRDLMVQLVLLVDFKCKVLQWDGVTVPMKEPIGMIGKSDLTSHEMSKVAMQTAEPASTRASTERLFRILESTCARANLKQIAHDATHLNADERTQSFRLLEYF